MCHPIHLTVTNVEYFQNKKNFVIQVRFFKDDLQKAIYLDTGTKPDFRQDNKQNNKLLLNYIKKYLVVKIDGYNLTQQFELENFTLQDITLWARIKVKYKHPEIRKVEITDKLMFNLYPDQQNLLIFVYKNHQKGLTFRRKHPYQVLTY